MYDDEVGEEYRFDDHSYEALAVAGVAWLDVIHVLYRARPRIRRHIGGVLRVSAPVRDGRWVVVSCIEERDDQYLVVGGRYLDHGETEAAWKMIRGDRDGQS